MSFSFKPLWKLLIDRNISAEKLRSELGFSFSTMSKMKKGENVSMDILDKICNYLNCKLSEIVEHIPSNNNTEG